MHTTVIRLIPTRSLADDLYFVPQQHLPKVVSMIVDHAACPELAMAAGTLLKQAITVAWARRPDGLLGLKLTEFHDTVGYFHYCDLFHAALHHDGDLREVDHMADLVGAALAGTSHLHR
ncbi:hypothetical protein DR950_17690 [Kitasatospora xanthocidica]|uniref:Uncharacterized protein n=1 Tax=Kitasatospora xanthocidica TaxID=83382 RepID=A0A372ZTY4_9ACTN|nr:hypothetical protein [Kitasatospora xanthocidica]RGD59376.1 hypothetical protein DR950_17690 [Kitasatospora xanthocidica]